MPIDAKNAERIVLLSPDDDYAGLYEVIWELHRLYPEQTLGEKYAAAEQAVRSLLERDWIRLYTWRGSFSNQEVEEIEPASVEEILSHPASWYPEYYGGGRIVFGATEEGERAWAEGALKGD